MKLMKTLKTLSRLNSKIFCSAVDLNSSLFTRNLFFVPSMIVALIVTFSSSVLFYSCKIVFIKKENIKLLMIFFSSLFCYLDTTLSSFQCVDQSKSKAMSQHSNKATSPSSSQGQERASAYEDLTLVQALAEFEKVMQGNQENDVFGSSQEQVTLDEALALLNQSQQQSQHGAVSSQPSSQRNYENSQAASQRSAGSSSASFLRRAFGSSDDSFIVREAEEDEYRLSQTSSYADRSREYDPLNPTLSDIFATEPSSQSTLTSYGHAYLNDSQNTLQGTQDNLTQEDQKE